MKKRSVKHDYRIEVFQSNNLLAWTTFAVSDQGLSTDTGIMPAPAVRLAVYDLLLLMARQICPFATEETWLEKRNNEHARIRPEEFTKWWERNHPEERMDGSELPW